MVSVQHDSGSSGLDSNPDWGHCVVFLGKMLDSHSGFLHPGVQMGTSEFNTWGNPAMDKHPIQGGVEIFIKLLTCNATETRISPGTDTCRSLGSYADRFWKLTNDKWTSNRRISFD